MTEIIIIIIIYGIVSAFMLTVGLLQLFSKKPVGFFSGEKPPTPDEITDVGAWNRKHGMMWMIYGAFILICGIVGALICYTPLCFIPLSGGMLLPIIFIILYHVKLEKIYRKK